MLILIFTYTPTHTLTHSLTHTRTVLEQMYNKGKVLASVCHGVACLYNMKNGGASIVEGKKVTGFSDEEEGMVKLIEVVGANVPETKLRALGGKYERSTGAWAPHVVVDKNLITGQNPASSLGVAEAVVEALK